MRSAKAQENRTAKSGCATGRIRNDNRGAAEEGFLVPEGPGLGITRVGDAARARAKTIAEPLRPAGAGSGQPVQQTARRKTARQAGRRERWGAQLRSRLHRMDPRGGPLKLKSQEPFTRNTPTIHCRGPKIPTPRSLRSQVGKIPAGSGRIERRSHNAA